MLWLEIYAFLRFLKVPWKYICNHKLLEIKTCLLLGTPVWVQRRRQTGSWSHYLSPWVTTEVAKTLILKFGPQMHKICRIFHMKFDCLFIAVPLSSEILKQNMDIYTEIDGGYGKESSHSILYWILTPDCLQFCVIWQYLRRMWKTVSLFSNGYQDFVRNKS